MKNKNPDYLGINGVRPARLHQKISRNILYNLLINIPLTKYEPIMEANLDDSDKNTLSPDVMVINRKTEDIEVIFEVCRTKQVQDNLNKMVNILNAQPTVKEAFVYDYERKEWYKFTPKKQYERKCYYSDIFNKDMSEYVNFVRRGVKL